MVRMVPQFLTKAAWRLITVAGVAEAASAASLISIFNNWLGNNNLHFTFSLTMFSLCYLQQFDNIYVFYYKIKALATNQGSINRKNQKEIYY